LRLTDDIYLVGSGALGFHITNAFDCNIYAIRSGSEVVLVDAGIGLDTERIIAYIRHQGLNPDRIRLILVTHYHGDHIGGLAQLRELTGAEVVASTNAAPAIEQGDEEKTGVGNLRQLYDHLSSYHLEPCKVDRIVGDGDVIDFRGHQIKVIATPGHCSGHVCYLVASARGKALFSGDCVFYGGRIMLQNIPDCDLQCYSSSIMHLAQLDVDLLLPGHMQVVLSKAQWHLETAARTFQNLGIPDNVPIPQGLFTAGDVNDRSK